MAIAFRLTASLKYASASVLLSSAEAKRTASISSVEEFWTFVAAVYAAVLLPIVAFVIYSAARDPAVREVWTLLCARVKQRTCCFLKGGSSASRSSAILDHHRLQAPSKKQD